jgi:hypothetical protein
MKSGPAVGMVPAEMGTMGLAASEQTPEGPFNTKNRCAARPQPAMPALAVGTQIRIQGTHNLI